MNWEEDMAREMRQAEDRVSQRAEALTRTMAARNVKIAELWRLIDTVVDRVNSRVALGRHRFRIEETQQPPTKGVFYGGRRILFEVEALAYDTWRSEPVFYPGGLARVFVEPAGRDLSALFCVVSEEGARWLTVPARRPVTDETIAALLRVLLH